MTKYPQSNSLGLFSTQALRLALLFSTQALRLALQYRVVMKYYHSQHCLLLGRHRIAAEYAAPRYRCSLALALQLFCVSVMAESEIVDG